MTQIREFIKDGTIEFHVGSVNDPNPKVCDKAEEIAQRCCYRHTMLRQQYGGLLRERSVQATKWIKVDTTSLVGQ